MSKESAPASATATKAAEVGSEERHAFIEKYIPSYFQEYEKGVPPCPKGQ
ncbi:hypothetical protein NC651_036605 [Populus alba x Populus x berolinensis]|nr:hypothetical protein NC651_036605 [Populus alba x Populus x berolinensis]